MNIYMEMKLVELPDPLVVQWGQRQNFTVPTYVGEATDIEMGFLQVERSEPGVIGHGQPFVKNKGGYGQLSAKDHTPHPEYIKVVIDGLTEEKTIDKTFGRENLSEHSAVKINGVWFAVRDLAYREPGRIKYANGKLELFLLDSRAPNYGHPIRYKRWSNTNIEDPHSPTNHRLPGGHMYMWDTYALEDRAFMYYTQDPHPVITDQQKAMLGYFKPEDRNFVKPRLLELIKSLVRVSKDASGKLKESKGSTGMFWYLCKGETRYKTWNGNDFTFDVPDDVQNIGWQTWGDFMWAAGLYNLGYLWTNTMFSIYMDMPDGSYEKEVAWWILQRFAKRELTTSLVWSEHNLSANHPRKGYRHYEKSYRGKIDPEVGAYYHPSNYKCYTLSSLTARELFRGQFWAEEGWESHREAVLNMGVENHNGDYGIRGIGWAMSNNVAAYKATGDQRHKNLAIAVADNWISLCKNQSRKADAEALLGSPEPTWDDNLGLPYVVNRQSNPKHVMQSWEFSKVLRGLIEVQLAFPETNYKPKIRQMGDFLVDELMYFDSDITMVRNMWRPDRVEALYNVWYSNIPTSSCSHLTWNSIPLAYCALEFRDQKFIDAFMKNYDDTFKQLDNGIGKLALSYSYWEGNIMLEKVPTGVKLNGDFTGVRMQHKVVIKRGQYFNHFDILEVNDNYLVIDCNEPAVIDRIDDWYYEYFVCGPVTARVTEPKHKAIKGYTRNTVNVPSLNAPIDWREGMFFNTHPKVWGQTLNSYTVLGFAEKAIQQMLSSNDSDVE